MKKPIAIIGTPGRVESSFSIETDILFETVGQNTGNIAFQSGASGLFTDARYHVGFAFDPVEVGNTCDTVCLPAANFLYSGFDLGAFADRLEQTKLPLVVIGLGAQAMASIDEVKLKPGTERLLRLFSERCHTIIVRGKYTADLLERYKVTNYRVGGCPSNFLHPALNLGQLIRARAGKPLDRVGFAPTFYHYNAGFEGALYAALGSRVDEIVAQDPFEAVQIARGETSERALQWLASKSGFLANLAPTDRDAALRRLRVYFDASAWMESYRRLDGVIGSRIHGVNLAWQAARPGLVVSYDLRTEELAETMCIPCVKSGTLDLGQLDRVWFEKTQSALDVYDLRRHHLAEIFRDALTNAHLTPSQGLANLAAPKPATTESSLAAVVHKPKFWGFLEQYNRMRIAGWVASDAADPPELLVKLGGSEIGRIIPKKQRSDIDGFAWSFELPVPKEAIRADVMQVEVSVVSTGSPLRNSPITTSFSEDDARKVLRGRDGWLFLQNDRNGVLDQIQGKRLLTDHELRGWEAFFLAQDRVCQQLGASSVYLVAPNKECVYANFLPGDITLSEHRPVYQLMELSKSLSLRAIQFCYPLEAFRTSHDLPTYTMGDSHWSDYGAAIAMKELFSLLPIESRETNSGSITDRFKMEYRNSDLLSKLGGTCVEQQPVLDRIFRSGLVSSNNALNTGRIKKYVSRSHEPVGGRALFAHDSFGDWMIPYLSERFSELTTLWSANLPADLIEEARPAIIIFERAERFLIQPPGVTRSGV